MARVVLEELTKVYPGGVKAADAVSLDVAHGELVVLVGPSGCGKSTTLRMVAGLEEISSGTLRIGERVVNEVPGRDRDVAMVFQSYALYPHLDVRANLAFPLERRRAHKSALRRLLSGSYRAAAREEDASIAAEVARAARTLGLEALLERKPGALSGGQRQRVAVGRALVRQPAVFLFDEPLSNLDAKLRVETRAELKALHRQLGATMLYVTHDQEEAMTLGDRLVVMDGGRVQQCAPPREVFDRPANRFVAGFVGTPAMNFVQAEVTSEAGQPALAIAGARVPAPPGLRPALARAEGRVTLGLRPDALRLDPSGPLAAELTLVEDLGDSAHLRLTLPGDVSWIARTLGGTRLDPGPLRLTPDLARAHLFAPGSHGARL